MLKYKLYSLLLWIFVSCYFSCVESFGDALSTASTPPHRGAARLKYGSGSLRPPGSKPVFATGQRQHGVKTTINPAYQNIRKIIPIIPNYHIPYPVVDQYGRISGGYPIYLNPDILHSVHGLPRSDRPSNRGGMYGGRPEYPNGRPNIGIGSGRYPFDYGFVPGKGFDPSDDVALGRYLPATPRKELGINMDKAIQHSDDDGDLHYKVDTYIPQCGEECSADEFLCIKSCTCIRNIFRCDGQEDCVGYEDEMNCNDVEYYKCKASDNFIHCPLSNKCISKDWLCDGDDDCGDYSDETHCGPLQNCTVDQFECTNGLCIPSNWLCDNDNDCKDFSDELNCSRRGCNKNEFECGDTSCISIGWKCDKQIDCRDGSDEADCDIFPVYCNEDEFKCLSQKCIKKEFRCDGDDDCDDWSDESDCPKIPANCGVGEFKCNSGKCIPERYRCDKQRDCEENEDEANCSVMQSKNCSFDEYTCGNGACILKTWICDGFNDCSDAEDESKCAIVCEESKFACSGMNSNVTEFCISNKYKCDGQKDCPKGEDEVDCPIKRECETGTPCKQLCVTNKDGLKLCSCLPGYTLNKNGYDCDDINECLYATNPVCSQTCNNTIGSFRCGCMTGYILRPDLRTCKAVGAPPTLLFANRIDIRQVSLSNNKYTSILKGLHNAIALDYHYEKKYIFWSDVSKDVIRRSYVNGTGVQDIIKWGLESPGGVALDWIHDLLFWTDSGTRRIEVASLDGEQRAVVIANDIDKPRAIAVHPGEALLFWSDWGPNPKIERAEMNGNNRKSIVKESVFWPNGLTLDYALGRIYWADAKHNVIETAFLDGSDRKKIISKGLPHPFAITIFEDAIFWTDWHTKSITTANKATGAGLRAIHSQLHFPMDIHSYHPQRQPKYPNRCGKNNGGCEHMCIPNAKSYTCVCRMGQKLNNDHRTCKQPEKLLMFARKKDLRLKHLDPDSTNQLEMVIPVDGIKSAVAIAWDSKNDYIYWTDVERDTINRALWNGSNQEVLISTNLQTPAGLALDWITNKIYWTDADTNRIEVANLNGEMRSLLVWEDLDKPRDIVVDPNVGYMFWSSWGEQIKIERAEMDGSDREAVITDNLIWPNGLAIDHNAGFIYWTDGGSKKIECAKFDGRGRRVVLEGPDILHPFGLDLYNGYLYWTDWQTLKIERASIHQGRNRTVLSSSMNNLMDVQVFHRNRMVRSSKCDKNNGGCSHLCLLKNRDFSCGCPTGIKIQNDNKTCGNGPLNYLLVAHRMDIRQISLDVPYMADVVLPLHRLKMATSVDVDRKTGEIYWADTAEDVIQKATPDGKNIKTIIMYEMELPDGIAIDSTGRKIYWTDGERNSLEVAELDGSNRKLLFSKDLDNPRALTLHYHHGLIFWSDWGKQAKIEGAHMDGTHRQTLISDDLGWPNGLAIDRPANRLYWNDAKFGKIESSDFDGKARRIIVTDLPHPYGLVVVGNHIYWTDWNTKALHRADKLSGEDGTVIKGQLKGLMDVRSIQKENIAENACGSNNGGCSHLCLRNPVSYTCACPTGVKMSADNNKVCEQLPQTFLLIPTSYGFTRISLDTDDNWEYTLPSDGANNILDVDFHWEKKEIYYVDIERNEIKSASMYNMSNAKVIVKDKLSMPNGVAVDWIADNVYFVNTGYKLIEVVRTDGSNRKAIIKGELEDPRAIAVFPIRGYLYWSDWGKTHTIQRSYTDGSHRRTIADHELNYPVSLTIDPVGKRLYWLNAKSNAEIIETTDLHGRLRVTLNMHDSHPFSLTQFEDHIYWTDWIQKSVIRADKATGEHKVTIIPHLDATVGLTIVAERRQFGWNPCAEKNGNCSHLCLFARYDYTCACPVAMPNCDDVPIKKVPLKCPHGLKKCYGDDDEWDVAEYGDLPDGDVLQGSHSKMIYVIIVVPLLCAALAALLALVYYYLRKGRKKYIYTGSRSFSNPNYCSSNNDQNGGNANTDKRPFIWKRLKYDKSQERVYEETAGANSPEVTSLIPTILTPCSSNCETVTPELERSPTVTPLHNVDSNKIVT